MKLQSIIPTLCGGLLLVTLPSCVVPGPPGPPVHATVGVGFYDALPSGFDEPYYYHGGHYYYGGRWETGHFKYNGHVQTSRYYHNGKYYYGGRYDAGHHHHDHH